MITFTVETWADIERDGSEIFKRHYDELALQKEVMPLGLDSSFYLNLEKNGYLLCIAARRDGRMIGYYIAMVFSHHPHNVGGGKVSTTDMFIILPEERKGGVGVKLLKAAEKELRRLGVVVATLSTKLHFENAELLTALGWEATDVVRKKVLTAGQ